MATLISNCTDAQLLREFAQLHSDSAFRELTRRACGFTGGVSREARTGGGTLPQPADGTAALRFPTANSSRCSKQSGHTRATSHPWNIQICPPLGQNRTGFALLVTGTALAGSRKKKSSVAILHRPERTSASNEVGDSDRNVYVLRCTLKRRRATVWMPSSPASF